jgi:chemotaxis protein methyltransferase CheR
VDASERFLCDLLELVYVRTGEDFRQYKHPSMLRRVMRRAEAEGANSLAELLQRAATDAGCLARLRSGLTLHVTSLFRDPTFFSYFRRVVVPYLHTYAHPRLWVAGCSTGQELFSYAIVLREEGLAARCTLYGTDLSETAIEVARSARLDGGCMHDYEASYCRAGGRGSLQDHLEREGSGWRVRRELLTRTVFASHNLIRDASLNEFNVISCRNVLMYMGETAQQQALRLIHDSLAPLGFLGLGSSEALMHNPQRSQYERLDPAEPWYRRIS